MKTSFKAFSNALKKYFVFSVEFHQIYYGIKNPKRFKLCILVCILNWIACFYHLIWITSDWIWLKTSGLFLPDKIKVTGFGLFILQCILLYCCI